MMKRIERKVEFPSSSDGSCAGFGGGDDEQQ